MKSKFLATGILTGIIVGILLSFFFPNLLLWGAQYASFSDTQLNLPSYGPKSGSVFNSLMIFPIFLGLLGGALGLILFKLKS